VLRGLMAHEAGVRIGGVILNRVASERHRALIADAVAEIGLPVLGAVPRDAALALPERHLGLVQAEELMDIDARLAAASDLVERNIDCDALVALAAPLAIATGAARRLPPPGRRIALARDAAFSFVYPHLLEGWRAVGAEIVPFSPLADEPPGADCDACWLPGGYPELHAGRLAANTRFLEGLRRFAATRPVHGECGGYMVLGAGLVDASGDRHAMAGLLAHATSFATRRLSLGYREARLVADGPLGPAGSLVRGHEFHYAREIEAGTDAPFAEIADAAGRPLGPSGGRRGRVTGSWFHAVAPA